MWCDGQPSRPSLNRADLQAAYEDRSEPFKVLLDHLLRHASPAVPLSANSERTSMN
ncbi:hypothetical protein AB0H86_08915 [Streptomyces sp. NPDC050997]|uniref:hypothetical protein n=1 Tax=Streptomyces sp. NPDC050997 TaxID=3155519 RepID=UPI00341D6E8F